MPKNDSIVSGSTSPKSKQVGKRRSEPRADGDAEPALCVSQETEDSLWDFPDLEDGGKKGGARRRKLKEAAHKVSESSRAKAEALSTKAKAVGEKSNEKSSKAAEAFSSALSAKVEKLAAKTSKASHRVTERFLDKDRPALDVVLLHDKISYTLSVVCIVGMAFTLGYAPFWYLPWNTVMAVVLLGRRWWSFKRQGAHYYMYDFCYWANLLGVVYSWFMPQSATLFHIVFLVSVGPLGWSIPTFTNSMIFHSAAHMTSVFIHLSPSVLTYALRWHIAPPADYGYHFCDDYPRCRDTSPWLILRDAYLVFYLPWAVCYFVWVYILMDKRIKERGYETLFEWIILQKPMAFVRNMSSNVMMQRLIYSGVHAVFALATMVVGLAAWYWHAVHLTLVMVWVTSAAWNASGFYFSVFAKRYVDELQRRAMSREESHAALAAHLEEAHASGGGTTEECDAGNNGASTDTDDSAASQAQEE